jgi:hypothetical protein
MVLNISTNIKALLGCENSYFKGKSKMSNKSMRIAQHSSCPLPPATNHLTDTNEGIEKPVANKTDPRTEAITGTLMQLDNGITPMTQAEAREAINEIKTSTAFLMKICYYFAHREGYKVLGYSSFKDCINEELTGVINYDYAHKMKNAGKIHLIVSPDTPMGSIGESVLRTLYKLPDDEKKMVWDQAVQKFGDAEKVTATTTKEVIRELGLEKPTKLRTRQADPENQQPMSDDGLNGNPPSQAILDPELQERLRQSAFEIIQRYIVKNGVQPDSKENFEEALKITASNILNFLSGKYKNLYGNNHG